eukprot:CAMPEP_0113501750 /NCGR_PEP_ID=MMETSP0014_2-20120614/33137_1 /TAXON_ID=2857 /ORGANISM="Nitzschia sp." /LENGTH=265 /DNA_ID=CAMNT_0000396391 /DNA_START=105 /DNA_END=899 /DNA_ORIENTATION=- /assembly_acc=CAM_ASM_000159
MVGVLFSVTIVPTIIPGASEVAAFTTTTANVLPVRSSSSSSRSPPVIDSVVDQYIDPHRQNFRRHDSAGSSTFWSLSSKSRLFDDDGSAEEDEAGGDEMAKEFYRQLREREQRSGQQNFQEVDEDSSSPSTNKKIKFTGRPTSPSPPPPSGGNRSSSRFFGGQNINNGPASTSTSSSNENRYVGGRQRIIEQEFNLVGLASSGRAIGFQAGLIALTLVFYIYVGLSGGIHSYSDDGTTNGGTPEDEIFAFEQSMPVQTDRETSVW